MKKIFILTLCMIFLVGTVSALEFDNGVKYGNNDLTAILEDGYWFGIGEWFGFNSELGTAELKSHKSVTEIKQFGYGKEEVVIYYDFEGWELYENGLGKVIFTDMNTGKEINKDYYFVERIVYEECIETGSVLNESLKTICTKRERWDKLKANDIPAKNITIGLKTFVNKGDLIDAVWTIAGKKISKHATWGAGLTVGNFAYYTFDDASGGTAKDEMEFEDGVAVDGTRIFDGTTGIINTAGNFETDYDNVFINNSMSGFIGSAQSGAVSLWFNSRDVTQSGIVWAHTTEGQDRMGIWITGAGSMSFGCLDDWQTSNVSISDDTWYHVVHIWDVGTLKCRSYVDTAIVQYNTYVPVEWGNNRSSFGSWVTSNPYNGTIDEAGFWNRTLTASEISDLYNGGSGLKYPSVDESPTVSLDTPINVSNFSTQTVDFICNASDDTGMRNITLQIDGVNNFTNSTPYYSFDGDQDYITMPNHASLNFGANTDFTLSAWIKTTAIGLNMIVWKGDHSDKWYQLYHNNGEVFGGLDDGVNAVWIDSDTSVNDGVEHHVACTFDRDGNGQVYIDGEVNGAPHSIVAVGDIDDIGEVLAIGIRGTDLTTYDFNGSIDETRIYNKSLSPAEVTSLYNQGREEILGSVALDNLISYWDLGQNNATDIRGTNDGTNEGALPSINLSRQVNGLTEGEHNWTCQAFDSTNQSGTTATRIFTIDTINPALIISAPQPIIDYHIINTNLFVNWSVNDTNLDACILEAGGTNTTLVCLDNSTEINITNSINKTATIYVNDTSGNVNSSLVNWEYKIFQEAIIYNQSLFETENGTFSINVSANSSLTKVNLVYNGSIYSPTQDGDLYTKYLDVPTTPGGKTFYWNFTYAEGSINATSHSQTINTLYFQYCNTTFNVPFANFTFKDETDDSTLNVTNELADVSFWMGGGTQTKSYINSTTSDEWSYGFCSNAANRTVIIDMTFKYSKTGYPLRTFAFDDTSLTNVTTNKTLYLLATAEGIYSSISVIESSGSVISGVTLQVERQFAGIWTLLGQDITGSDGVATFWVNPNFQHRITATKTGYITTQVTITPSQTIYTLTLSRTSGDATYVSDLPGIKWIALPQIGSISPGTKNFNVTVTSSESNLENCKFELVNTSNLSQVFDSVTSFTNSSYCFLGIDYNAQAGTKFFGRLSLDTDTTTGFVIVNADWKWIVMDIDAKAWRSITSFFADLKTLSEFGEGNKAEFSRIVTFFLLTTIIFGIFIYFSGVELTSPGVTILLIWGITLFASAGGFLTFDSGSANVNPTIEQFGFFFIFTIYMVNYFLTIIRRANE